LLAIGWSCEGPRWHGARDWVGGWVGLGAAWAEELLRVDLNEGIDSVPEFRMLFAGKYGQEC